jgi:hypothetical protein
VAAAEHAVGRVNDVPADRAEVSNEPVVDRVGGEGRRCRSGDGPPQKERLADEIFRMQPSMLGSILVLSRLGVPIEKVEFAVGVLLVCFQAMKESGLAWPVITEDEQERQLARFVAATRLGEDITPSLRSRALRRYISAHPEKSLAAYVASDTSKWLGEIAADESDKYAMLAVWNLVNCIAFAELPRSKHTKPT